MSLMRSIHQPNALTVNLQPIFRHTRDGLDCVLLEALVRGPQGTHLADPSVLFEYVRRKQEEVTVDRLCLTLIVGAAVRLPPGVRISVNVHASTLAQDPNFPGFVLELLERHEIAPERLVVEVIEHSPTWLTRSLRTALDELRDAGVGIALDDFGTGSSNFSLLLECRPQLIKLDRSFVRHCDTRPELRLLAKTSLQLAEGLGAELIAEGVETEAELGVLGRLGVRLFQGHLLARPLPPETIRRFFQDRTGPDDGSFPHSTHDASKGCS